MKKLEFIMGMPVIIEICDDDVKDNVFEKIFDYFRYVDEKYSPFKPESEVSLVNRGKLKIRDVSSELQEILELCDKTNEATDGYFDPFFEGTFDPSGMVKGWAIYNASKILDNLKIKNYYVNAGGDIQTSGHSQKGEPWQIGIRNPFNTSENVKVVMLTGEGIATSGTYEKGEHIYNPKGSIQDEIISLTVIGPNIYEADRFATPAFAMGKKGIDFVEKRPGIEGYMIDKKGIATYTSGFEKYVKPIDSR
jgi:FAD:protein FMN transferase